MKKTSAARFSINLSMLFQELPFMRRFAAAAQAGFKAVEFMFPYDYAVADLKKELSDHHLKLVLINLPAGNFAAGERGIALDPRRREEFQQGVASAVAYARELGVPQINCLVGKTLADISVEEQHKTLLSNLAHAADSLERSGIRLLVEHLNSKDVPGFALDTTAKVLSVVEEIGHPNIYLQYDIYHAQRMEGELATIVRTNLAKISHIQIADNPGRHQPGTGEINYRWLLNEIITLGYDGHIGLEYLPQPDSLGSLDWIEEFGYSL